ncbi:MAG: recombinase RecA [Dehalococcoidia bacterium]|nr:recombinase RecA [Dehalococcoidia bacterium]
MNGKKPDEKNQLDERRSERDQAVDQAISQIERQFGKGSIMWLGDSGARLVTDMIPTGVISLDIALGIGGLPRGRVIEIYGPEGGGKTTLALNAVGSAQRAGGVAAFVDAEHALDPVWAGTCGVDVEHLLVSQPDTGEQALEITEMLVRSGAVDLIVVDSVAALVPRAEIEGDMGDSLPGMQARLMSQALRKLTSAISKSHTVVVFINQIREKIGVLFGNPETTPGGRALKFYSSMRLEIRRAETLKSGSDSIGMRAKVTVRKNKLAPPFRICEFDIMFTEGVSRFGGLLDVGVDMDIVRKAGAHYSFGETRLGMGRENAKTYLKENEELANELESQVRARAADFRGVTIATGQQT